jgi:hypothetical protein
MIMYYLRCAVAGALVGAFLALMVSPAKAEILQEKKLPHGWEVRMIAGEDGNPEGCSVSSDFESIGTNPKVLPRGKTATLLLIKRYNAPGAAFTIWSDHWSFPTGFEPKLVFNWDDEQQAYDLNMRRWREDPTALEAGVSQEFVEDFAAKRQMNIMINGEIVGAFPLVGSRAAMNALEECSKYLPSAGGKGWDGDSPKKSAPPTWNGKKGDA